MDRMWTFLTWLFLVGMLGGTFLVMVYMGYSGVTSGNLFETLFGIFLLSLAAYLPFNFLVKNERVRDRLLMFFGSFAALGLFGVWGLIAIALMAAPFLDVDLTIDLGLIIVKSAAVKFLLILADIFVIYFLWKWISDYVKAAVAKRQKRGSKSNQR